MNIRGELICQILDDDIHHILLLNKEGYWNVRAPIRDGTALGTDMKITHGDFYRIIDNYIMKGDICSFTGNLSGNDLDLLNGGNFNDMIFFDKFKIKVLPYLRSKKHMSIRAFINEEVLDGVTILVDGREVDYVIGCTRNLANTISTLITVPIGNRVTIRKDGDSIFDGEMFE